LRLHGGDLAGSAPAEPEGAPLSLFFDAAWFDARLAARGLTRDVLGERLGVDAVSVETLFSNRRQAAPDELAALAALLNADLVEVTLRAGVSGRPVAADDCASARIERIEARLDAIDQWIEDFERQHRKSA
jgi:transcriptional regulator with XRE-family HTH domain